MSEFLTLLEKRRSIYSLGKDLGITQDRVQEIVKHCVKHTPSAFNSQTTRAVILFDDKHDFLWDTTLSILKGIVDPNNFASTQQKIKLFKAAAGTILFYENKHIVEELQTKFALYKSNIPTFASQSMGMLQNNIWLAFATENVGASLQHYNPLIDDAINTEFKIKSHWTLTAQMPFGNIISPAGNKDFSPMENRVLVFR